jgi:hypothetical protein
MWLRKHWFLTVAYKNYVQTVNWLCGYLYKVVQKNCKKVDFQAILPVHWPIFFLLFEHYREWKFVKRIIHDFRDTFLSDIFILFLYRYSISIEHRYLYRIQQIFDDRCRSSIKFKQLRKKAPKFAMYVGLSIYNLHQLKC